MSVGRDDVFRFDLMMNCSLSEGNLDLDLQKLVKLHSRAETFEDCFHFDGLSGVLSLLENNVVVC